MRTYNLRALLCEATLFSSVRSLTNGCTGVQLHNAGQRGHMHAGRAVKPVDEPDVPGGRRQDGASPQPGAAYVRPCIMPSAFVRSILHRSVVT